ncbi:hypothetical protein [Thalassotalea marina]|uniref:Uncharacterized protein n=1 Tax=Thalassotalea marina TaxID=1673741 RepID=A0A919EHA1_9GAMM|nr:hypothetical protein [Thalassotalea marina]GHF78262.1 hypothetical protein GCM10017161_01630 [Thalassotalea marina]
MKKLLSRKSTLFSLSLLLGAGASYATTCEEDCERIARQEQAVMCAGQAGASACASSEPLFNYLYNQCLQNYCSN